MVAHTLDAELWFGPSQVMVPESLELYLSAKPCTESSPRPPQEAGLMSGPTLFVWQFTPSGSVAYSSPLRNQVLC